MLSTDLILVFIVSIGFRSYWSDSSSFSTLNFVDTSIMAQRYTEDEWADVMDQLKRLTEDKVKMLRPLFALAELCYIGGDAITLPGTLLCHARIETDAVLETGDDGWLLRRG